MYRKFIASCAIATLTAASIIMVVFTMAVASRFLDWANPDILETTRLKVYIVLSLVLGPIFVLMVLNWFKQDSTKTPKPKIF